MTATDGLAPQGPAGIPNFAWVEEGRLARGMQPPLTLAAYTDLRATGFCSVLSLRLPQEYLDEDRRRYDVAQERALCEAVGLRLYHVPLTDYQAPRPSELVRALAVIRAELARGGALYVHCFAGVGRTGVVCGAWQILHGMSGSEALRQFEHFLLESWQRVRLRRPDLTLEQYLSGVGAPSQAWVLLRVAEALERPATPPSVVRPRRPARGAHWRQRFREQVQRHLGLLPGLAILRGQGGSATQALPTRPTAAAGFGTRPEEDRP
jgi:protein-tyrosine phosphatase